MENNYNKVLELFTFKKKNTLTEYATSPFLFKGFALATDFNSMVLIPEALTEGIKPVGEDVKANFLAPSVVPEDKSGTFVISIDTLKEAISKCDTEEGYDTLGEDIECKECKGSGEVEWSYDNHTKDDDCPICKGDGLSQKSYKKKNGKKQLIGWNKGLIKDSAFAAHLVEKIVLAAEILGVNEVTLLSQRARNSSSLFKVGDVEVLLMPIMYEDEDTELKFSIQ